MCVLEYVCACKRGCGGGGVRDGGSPEKNLQHPSET